MVGNFRNIWSFNGIIHVTIKVPATGTSQQNLPPNTNFEDEDEVILVSPKPGKSGENVKMEKQNTGCYIILY